MKHALSKPRLLTIAFAATALLAVSGWASATPMPLQHYSANLSSINGSGVTGTAHLAFNPNSNMLQVNIHATGLEANTHPEHIHGTFAGNNGPLGFQDVKPGSTPTQAILPTVAADDGDTGAPKDGLVETAEGLKAYGPILVPLTINGVSVANGGVFPTVGANGILDYSETFNLGDGDIYQVAKKVGNTSPYSESDLMPLNFREIVIHGMDNPLSTPLMSVFAGLPGSPTPFAPGQYDPFLPVAVGVIGTPVSAVPEPADLGMMLGGLGLILGFLWLRRRDVSRREDA